MDACGFVLAVILRPQQLPKPQAFDYHTMRQRIRKAYLEVTGNRLNTRALLSELRNLRDRQKVGGQLTINKYLRGNSYSSLKGIPMKWTLKLEHIDEAGILQSTNSPHSRHQAICFNSATVENNRGFVAASPLTVTKGGRSFFAS
jgi:hypothetical protein